MSERWQVVGLWIGAAGLVFGLLAFVFERARRPRLLVRERVPPRAARRGARRVVGALAVAAVGLTGCGGDGVLTVAPDTRSPVEVRAWVEGGSARTFETPKEAARAAGTSFRLPAGVVPEVVTAHPEGRVAAFLHEQRGVADAALVSERGMPVDEEAGSFQSLDENCTCAHQTTIDGQPGFYAQDLGGNTTLVWIDGKRRWSLSGPNIDETEAIELAEEVAEIN